MNCPHDRQHFNYCTHCTEADNEWIRNNIATNQKPVIGSVSHDSAVCLGLSQLYTDGSDGPENCKQIFGSNGSVAIPDNLGSGCK